MAEEVDQKDRKIIVPRRSYYEKTSDFVRNWVRFSEGKEPVIPTIDNVGMSYVEFIDRYNDLCWREAEFCEDDNGAEDEDEDFYEDERGVRALLSEAFNREYLDLVVNSGLVYGPINNYEARFSDRFYRVLSPFFKEGSRGIVESFRRCAKACLDPYSALRERSCYCNSDHDDHTIEIGIMLVSAGIGTTFYTTFPYVSNPLYQLSQDASFVSVMVYSLARWTYDTGAFGTSDPFDHEYIKWFDQSIICVS